MDDAAKQLKISRRTITRWVSERNIRVYKVPGDRHRYVDLDEIRRFRTPQVIDLEERG